MHTTILAILLLIVVVVVGGGSSFVWFLLIQTQTHSDLTTAKEWHVELFEEDDV